MRVRSDIVHAGRLWSILGHRELEFTKYNGAWLADPSNSITWSVGGLIQERWRWRKIWQNLEDENEEGDDEAGDNEEGDDEDGDSKEGDGREGIPFDDTTMFYETISTELGKRQMSTFPMVRALCNALVLAGFRGEMDDEGDIWFEDDDGDPYCDAREYQPGPDEDDGVVANCPICQNPEKYGLGDIVRRAEAGVRYIQEFREARERKRKGKHGYS